MVYMSRYWEETQEKLDEEYSLDGINSDIEGMGRSLNTYLHRGVENIRHCRREVRKNELYHGDTYYMYEQLLEEEMFGLDKSLDKYSLALASAVAERELVGVDLTEEELEALVFVDQFAGVDGERLNQHHVSRHLSDTLADKYPELFADVEPEKEDGYKGYESAYTPLQPDDDRGSKNQSFFSRLMSKNFFSDKRENIENDYDRQMDDPGFSL